MVVIRLSRGGTNKRPFYTVVVADRRASRDGCYLERLGYFNPIATGGEKRLELDRERISHWIGQGAQPSERVAHLLRELDKPEILEKRKAKSTARKTHKKEKAKAEAVATEVKEEVVAEEAK
ncbi:MAG: hypothetical protein ACD_21C00224G0002 [uncultured bacterium]|nr:MAG: hypothetical protein ACD_21C00224G0002 [uncultured bacterium]